MSNVEYRCSHTNEAGHRDCGSKLFALPGGTRKTCRHHPESKYVQTEEGHGPDFLFIDEDGKTRSKDAIVGEEKKRAAREDEVKGQVEEVAPTGEQVILRGVYQTLTGTVPDLRWGAERLKQEIQEYGESLKGEQEGGTVTEPADAGEANLSDGAEGEDDGSNEDPTVEPTDKGEIVDSIPD